MIFFDDDVMEKNKGLLSLANALHTRINRPSDRWMRFYNVALAARMLSGDLSGIKEMTSWNWDQPSSIPMAQELVDDYGVSLETAQKALDNIAWAEDARGLETLDPFIFRQSALFIGKVKNKLFKSLMTSLIEKIAEAEEKKNISQLILLLQDIWMNSLLGPEVESFLRPKPREHTGRILSHKPPSSAGKDIVDVNTIALGVEYTGRFPLSSYAASTGSGAGEIVFQWNNREKENLMKDVAQELSHHLGGTGETQKISGGHGHNLGYSHTFLDGKGRSWRVDWDGIQRRYDDEGKAVQETVSGGHLEVVTAKFIPRDWEIEAVYKVFKKFHIIQSHSGAGGGHINVDLAPFEGRPHAMARFLALFHEYEDIIYLMFHHGDVLDSYTYPFIDDDLLMELEDFQGTEEELKETLYNNRYFNSYKGDKTRYTPLNIIPYFQDVIPKELLGEDLDIYNPTVPWEPRFRFVKPEHKRMELRFFSCSKRPF